MRLPRLHHACLIVALAACNRPVGGRDLAQTSVSALTVTPEFIRAGTPIVLSFRLTGDPVAISYTIAGRRFDCDSVTGADGRARCTHPSIDNRAFREGPAEVTVEARDRRGRIDTISVPVVIDFECPRVVSLSLSTPIAEAGDVSVVNIEVSEDLETPPEVSRLGRSWETPAGDGRTYALSHAVGFDDPGATADVLVVLVDPAGNRSNECGGNGRIAFSVDHTPPVANIHDVRLTRGLEGEASTIRAGVGAFLDDVGIDHINVMDATGGILGVLIPEADGSVSATSLAGQTRSRVLLEAVDRFGRISERHTITEQWRLSVGAASTPGSSVRTASRLTPAPPNTSAMHNRTLELAPAVRAEDTRSAVVTTVVGVDVVGQLPVQYEDANLIPAAYDPVGRAVVAVGGYRGDDYQQFANYLDDVSVIRWDEGSGEYRVEPGPSLSDTATTAPVRKYGRNTLAFDRHGCAILNGGRGWVFSLRAWQLCFTPGGYTWRQLEGLEVRNWPLVYDAPNDRFWSIEGERAQVLEPNADRTVWTFEEIPVPSNWGRRNSQIAYHDLRNGGIAVGLHGSHFLTYLDNQWVSSNAPLSRRLIYCGNGSYDAARKELIAWGGSGTCGFQNVGPPDPLFWILSDTSTNSASSLVSRSITPPLPRYEPTMVFDSDREVTLLFGGIRYNDARFVPPEIHQLITAPAYPHLQATIDLGAARPKGIERIRLILRAKAVGDADGTGPGGVQAGGVQVLLWDHEAGRWDRVATTEGDPSAPIASHQIDVTTAPARYIALDGTMPLTLISSVPATETVDARLEVDLIDGYLELRSGVSLP